MKGNVYLFKQMFIKVCPFSMNITYEVDILWQTDFAYHYHLKYVRFIVYL